MPQDTDTIHAAPGVQNTYGQQPLVFITGASSGIGRALAWRFYQAGYRLALVARRAQAVHGWAQQNSLEPQRYVVYAADVRNVEQITAAA